MEISFNLHRSDGQHTVKCHKVEEYHSDCIQHTIKHPMSKIVWGCVSDEGVGGLHFMQGTVNAQVYIGILEEKLLPTIREKYTSVQNVTFQDDSAPCHKAKLVSNTLKTFILPLNLN